MWKRETLRFQHLDLVVMPPRVGIFRETEFRLWAEEEGVFSRTPEAKGVKPDRGHRARLNRLCVRQVLERQVWVDPKGLLQAPCR